MAINRFNAQIEYDKGKTNHLLHLVLSFLTAGVWIPVWILIASNNTAKRNRVNRAVKAKQETNWLAALFVLALLAWAIHRGITWIY